MKDSRGGGSNREKRRHRRGYSIQRVTYGIDKPFYKAPAQRLSPGGVFIATNDVVYAPGIELVMDVEIKGEAHRVHGIVRHALKVEHQFVRMAKPGMGVEFVDPPGELVLAIEGLR